MKQLFDFTFLKKIDTYFLLNHRLLWITKAHYVLVYGALFYLLMFMVINLYPMSLRQDMEISGWFSFGFSILAIIPACIWVHRQVLYSIENNYGSRFKGMTLARVLIYSVFFAMLVSVPLFSSMLVDYKISRLVSDEELIEDIVTLNIGNKYIFIESTDYPAKSRSDKYDYRIAQTSNFFTPRTNNCYRCIFQKTNKFKNIPSYLEDNSTLEKIQNYIKTAKKYGAYVPFSAKEVYEAYRQGESILDVREFNLPKGSYSFSQITNKLKWKINDYVKIKEGDVWWNNQNVFIFSILLITFLTNLLLLFKNINVRTSILTLVSLVALVIGFIATMVTIVEALRIRGSDADNIAILLCLGIYGFFLLQGLSIFKLKTYSRFKQISLTLVSLVTPFLGFFAVVVLDEWNIISIGHNYTDFRFVLMSTLFGIFLYFGLLLPIFNRLFIKLKVIPKQH